MNLVEDREFSQSLANLLFKHMKNCEASKQIFDLEYLKG